MLHKSAQESEPLKRKSFLITSKLWNLCKVNNDIIISVFEKNLFANCLPQQQLSFASNVLHRHLLALVLAIVTLDIIVLLLAL